MLGKCETGKVAMIYTLDKVGGFWNGRAIFLNEDSDNFSELFTKVCFENAVCLNFKESLEVNYESRFD